eukprot:m.98114 g.98114  ORF g.98114 m.98114 type:complete len:599 (-) comp8852_c0_seq2:2081-3877(-)
MLTTAVVIGGYSIGVSQSGRSESFRTTFEGSVPLAKELNAIVYGPRPKPVKPLPSESDMTHVVPREKLASELELEAAAAAEEAAKKRDAENDDGIKIVVPTFVAGNATQTPPLDEAVTAPGQALETEVETGLTPAQTAESFQTTLEEVTSVIEQSLADAEKQNAEGTDSTAINAVKAVEERVEDAADKAKEVVAEATEAIVETAQEIKEDVKEVNFPEETVHTETPPAFDADDAMLATEAAASSIAALVEEHVEGAAQEEEEEGLSENELSLRRAERRVHALEQALQHHVAAETERVTHALDKQRAHLEHKYSEERKAELEAQRARLEHEFQQQLATEVENVKRAKLLEMQENLRVNDAEHERITQVKLNKQAEEIRAASEAELRFRLGRERAHRIVVLEQYLQRLKALESVLADQRDAAQETRDTHALFMASENVAHSIGERSSLRREIDELRALGAEHELVREVLDSIPESAINGVPSLVEIKSRFEDMATAARRVALVPPGGGIWSHIVSAAVSVLKVPRQGLVEGDDTEAILARAQTFLKLNDLDMATREINQLRGESRRVAQDWLEDARRHLEVFQALTIVRAYATEMGLSHL